MNLISNAKRITKAAHRSIITDLCNQIDIAKKKQNLHANDRIPHKLVANLVSGMETVCPWLNRNVIMNEHRRRKAAGIFYEEEENALVVTENTIVIYEQANGA